MVPDFTLADFRKQLEQLKGMVLRGEVPADIPGMGDRISGGEDIEKDLGRIQGMIDAMTQQERDNPDLLDQRRCRRIAAGAGIQPQDVEQFLGHFKQVRVLMKKIAQLSI